MARKATAGERARDERRRVATPRMHGHGWHDHPEPREIAPDVRPDASDLDALPEAEAAPEREGITKRKRPRGVR